MTGFPRYSKYFGERASCAVPSDGGNGVACALMDVRDEMPPPLIPGVITPGCGGDPLTTLAHETGGVSCACEIPRDCIH